MNELRQKIIKKSSPHKNKIVILRTDYYQQATKSLLIPRVNSCIY